MNSAPSSPPSPVSSQPSRKRQRRSSMLSDTSSSSLKRSLSDGPSQDGDPLATLSISDSTQENDTYMSELAVDTVRLAPAAKIAEPPAAKLASVDRAKSRRLQEGDTWYVVDRNWWTRWRKACTGFVDKEGSVTEDELGPVDNSRIVDASGRLRIPLIDGVDFELVPGSVWKAFTSWYGLVKHPLPREVILRGQQKEATVELYPLHLAVMRMTRYQPRATDTESPPYIDISAAHTMLRLACDLSDKVRPEGMSSLGPFRVWKVNAPLTGFTSDLFFVDDLRSCEGVNVDSNVRTLDEVGVMQGDTFVVEFKDDIGWMAESVEEMPPPPLEMAVAAIPDPPVFPSNEGFFTRMGNQRSKSPRELADSRFPSFSRGSLNNSSTSKSLEPGTLGLGNMGNTCFMNSLSNVLAAGVFQKELNPDNPLGMHGAIAEAFGALLQRIWATSGPSTSFSPREFKSQLQRFAPQFSGYQQHDSQELVAFLLDGLHEDLNRVLQKPYVEKPDWEGGGDVELVNLAQKSWDGYMLRNDSVIVDLFQGQYQSTLVCPECQKVSITFDPFMYLTLPLPVQKKWKHNIFYVPWDLSKPHVKVPVELGRDASFRDLRQLLGRWMGAPPDNLLTLEIFSHKFYKNLDDGLLCGEMASSDTIDLQKQPDDPTIVPVYLCDFKPPLRPNSLYGSYQNISHFGYPTVVVIDQKQATDRWTNNARDLFTWESVPIQINGVAPLDSLVEIKVNGDVVEPDEDVQMEEVVVPSGKPVRVAPKRGIFQLKLQPNMKDYGTTNSFIHSGKLESRRRAGIAARGGRVMCEFDENMKAYYFGEGHRYEDARWDHWEQFVHPEYEDAQKEAEEKKNKGISLQDCLDEFTKEEQLGEDDLWYCPRCKKHQQATKKFDLWKAPDVLVVHLKRFSNSRTMRDKIDAFIDFPVDGLDLGDMRLIEAGESLEGLQLGNLDEPLIYDLFGVDEHMGGLGGGHYRAYALNHVTNKWYHFDDSHVSPAHAEDAVNPNAYLLFYRRRTTEPLGGKTHAKIDAARLNRTSEPSEPSSDEGIPLDAQNDDFDIIPGLSTFPPRSTMSASGSSPSSRDEPPDLDDPLDMSLSDDPLARSAQRFDFPDPSSNKASPASSTEAEGDPDMWTPYTFNDPSSPNWSPLRMPSPSDESSLSGDLNPFTDAHAETIIPHLKDD
ncbi:hypothetical protein B0H10DRAFT_2021101 [Mycena sp. CBHHK59/15]|nr:hypothetical protein B0H10DRAFT_2021101 [Mycena sp. CBHHK59/15]